MDTWVKGRRTNGLSVSISGQQGWLHGNRVIRGGKKGLLSSPVTSHWHIWKLPRVFFFFPFCFISPIREKSVSLQRGRKGPCEMGHLLLVQGSQVKLKM